MINIVIVGAGQLGSRHLQAIKGIDYKANITVLDPSSDALAKAKELYKSMKPDYQMHNIIYTDDYRKSPKNVDIAIIATGSKVRKRAIFNLLSQSIVKYIILEKILFANKNDYYEIDDLLDHNNVTAWVNCPLTTMELYKKVSEKFKNNILTYDHTGGDYGLATTLIHHIDYLSYICGTDEFTIDVSYLSSELLDSKRKGYYEMTGTILIKFKNGCLAKFTKYQEGDLESMTVISNEQTRVSINGLSGNYYEKNTEGKISHYYIPIPYQSIMTTKIVNNIIKKHTCELPTYKSSKKLHLNMIDGFKKYLLDKKYINDCEFPFT